MLKQKERRRYLLDSHNNKTTRALEWTNFQDIKKKEEKKTVVEYVFIHLNVERFFWFTFQVKLLMLGWVNAPPVPLVQRFFWAHFKKAAY